MSFKITKTFWLIVLGLFFILIWGLIFFNQGEQIPVPETPEDIQEPEQIEESDNLSQIDLSLEQGPEAKLPIALILDNFSESWPISGINLASVVYEASMEADITRFLIIFNQDFLPDKVGPVRSARSYLTDWAEEYGALFVHAGGSPDFLQKIKDKEYQIYNLDEISHDGTYFWRDSQRDKPHNLYVSKQSVLQAIGNKKLANVLKPDFIPWPYNQTPYYLYNNDLISRSLTNEVRKGSYNQLFLIDEEPNNLIVKIDYREPVIWQFDKDQQAYLRFQDGKPFVDENGEQVQTPNLIIQKTEIKILDAVGRRFIKTLGQGEALVFQKGFLIKGRWQKSEKGQRTRFYNSQGQEIEFLPGSIWVQIVSDDHQILYN